MTITQTAMGGDHENQRVPLVKTTTTNPEKLDTHTPQDRSSTSSSFSSVIKNKAVESELNTTCMTTASTVTAASRYSNTTTPNMITSTPHLTNPTNCATMTLTISASNAQQMLEASRSLNSTLHKLQKEKINDDNPISTNDNENDKSTSSSSSLAKLLIEAATSPKIHNPLLSSFVQSMQNDVSKKMLTEEEMIISLLLFLDLDKSNKLLTAFEVLVNGGADSESVTGASSNDDSKDDNSSEMNEEELCNGKKDTSTSDSSSSTKMPSLNRNELRKLFQSFLMSICTCINYKNSVEEVENSNNTADLENLSNKARKIQENDSPHSTIKKEEVEDVMETETTNQNDCDSSDSKLLVNYLISDDTKS